MKIQHITIAMLLVPLISFAQPTNTPPSAGLTPQSSFYFLDRLGEAIQELLTINPESKIRIQIAFAVERIAEIQIDMEAKEVDAKGLDVAQTRLEKHLSKASQLISEEKGKGKDVGEWEEMLKEEFEVSKDVLDSSFELAKDILEDQREEIKMELELAKKNNDTAQVERLTRKLDELEDDKEELEQEREDQKDSLEEERERFDDDEDDGDEDMDEDSDDEGTKSSTGSNTSVTPSPTPVPTNASYTMAQVATHNNISSCWSVVGGVVYNLTSWISKHPGGQQAILSICGKDGTAAFEGQHNGQSKPENTIASFKIGVISQ